MPLLGLAKLFWSGGMRLAWKTALKQNKDDDAFLLLKDDMLLMMDIQKFQELLLPKNGLENNVVYTV